MFQALFQSFCTYEIFVKLNLPVFPVLVSKRGKSQKYFGLLAFSKDLNHSNPWNTLGAMHVRK